MSYIKYTFAKWAITSLLVTFTSAQSSAQDAPDKPSKVVKSDSPRSTSEDAERPKPAKISATISPTQEESILAFVSKHDAPLHGLLGNLRASRPQDYQKALTDLNRVTERLAQVKKNRPHIYELEVKRWQAQSKVQMLAAHLATKPDPEIRTKLKQAIEERADLELQVLRADRLAAEKRLKQLDEQIALAESSMQNRVQLQFDRALAVSRKARAGKNSDVPKKRPESEGAIPTRSDPKTSNSKSNASVEKDSKKSESPSHSSNREGASS